MTIKRVETNTEIKANQWITKESMMIDAICGLPRKVVKVSNNRVYFTNRHGEDEGNFCLKRSIKFVSDSKEELEIMYAISLEQEKELSATRKEVLAKYRTKIQPYLEK